MSANDILDVLNIQRDSQPAKKKQKVAEAAAPRQTGMARELYSLLGPNTPPINVSGTNGTSIRDKINFNASPWTKMPFTPNSKKNERGPVLHHWVKGSKELLQAAADRTPYFFDKFNVTLDIPEFVDEEKFNKIMEEIRAEDKKKKDAKERERRAKEEKDDQPGEPSEEEEEEEEWEYGESKRLFELCRAFELKWHVIHDRHAAGRTLEELKDHFYRVSAKILASQENNNPQLIEQLGSFSKDKETERKKYLESLLKRTPAEIAEEESLVIEARRFELAAKKMLMERSHLLSLLDLPQTSQSVSQYQSSQGLANLYNNLMVLDKHQKRKFLQQQQRGNLDPVPPPIPMAASSSYKKDRTFQTHLQQYLSGLLKQQNGQKHEPNAIQELLAKRLTPKEEEAYGLHYHGLERLTPGVILRSTQRLSGLQQRQSVLKSVNAALQEMDIPTAGGTSWKPIMPTRKTMAKYDELLRAVVALLDIKKGKDKLESEIRLIKSQREL